MGATILNGEVAGGEEEMVRNAGEFVGGSELKRNCVSGVV